MYGPVIKIPRQRNLYWFGYMEGVSQAAEALAQFTMEKRLQEKMWYL
jgi:hypothetical protein